MKDKLTILTPTHSFKIETSGGLEGYFNNVPSAPSTELIEASLDSIYAKTNLYGCRHIISLDNKGTELDEAYVNNLKKLEDKWKHVEVIESRCNTQDPKYTATNNFLLLRDLVDTEFFLQWEHDWIFLEDIDMEKLLKLFDDYNFINYIRFNQHKNEGTGVWSGDSSEEFLNKNLESEPRVKEVPLLRTNEWSGNPHICRTNVWRNWWKNMVYPNPYCYVEQCVKEVYWFSIEKMGWELARERWGVYIYGEEGWSPTVGHLDGNAFVK